MNEDQKNIYGDSLKPTPDGRGVDIASQRQDDLDKASLEYLRIKISSGETVNCLDLGGGVGTHSLAMAHAGAYVTMIDVQDIAKDEFARATKNGAIKPEQLSLVVKDFLEIKEADLPTPLQLVYSQRAIHYIPYNAAQSLLKKLFNHMTSGSMIYISAAGHDTEYGQSYPDRNKPIENRFNFVTPDMQLKHGITHKIATYSLNDMQSLLTSVGFSIVTLTQSTFGNIKASARKPGPS